MFRSVAAYFLGVSGPLPLHIFSFSFPLSLSYWLCFSSQWFLFKMESWKRTLGDQFQKFIEVSFSLLILTVGLLHPSTYWTGKTLSSSCCSCSGLSWFPVNVCWLFEVLFFIKSSTCPIPLHFVALCCVCWHSSLFWPHSYILGIPLEWLVMWFGFNYPWGFGFAILLLCFSVGI